MKKTSSLVPAVFVALACLAPIHGNDFRISGISLGVGDWINVSDGDWDTREDYGTLPAAALYWTGWGWNGSVGAPFKSAFKRVANKLRFSPGDGEVSVGKRFGDWSPRISLKFPLYAWSVEDATENELFIGSGTWDLALGVGGRLPKEYSPRRVTLQFDVEASTVVAKGLADYGSSHGLGTLQAAYALGGRWKAGLTALFLFDHWIWIPDYWDQEGETKFSLIPGPFVGARLFRSTYVDLKAGWNLYEYRKLVKPRFAVREQDSYYFGASLYQAFK